MQGWGGRAIIVDMAMDHASVVTKRSVISNENVRMWVPETTVVQGIEFLEISKWDRKLTQFCLGRKMLLVPGSTQHINVSFIENLQSLRTKQCVAAVQLVLAEDARCAGRKRQRAAKGSDGALVDRIHHIVVPQIICPGFVVDAMEMKVLYGVKNNTLWVEMTPQNLDYIRHGVLHSNNLSCSKRKFHNVQQNRHKQNTTNL